MLTHWKRLWCWQGLGTGGEGDGRGWDGWMASLTQWTWIWVNSGSWWWTGWPGVRWFMRSQRVGHDWATELNWTEVTEGFPHSSIGKEPVCSAGYLGLILGFGRSPEEGNGNPLQYSCLENPMARGAWQDTVHGAARVWLDSVTKPPPTIQEHSWPDHDLTSRTKTLTPEVTRPLPQLS